MRYSLPANHGLSDATLRKLAFRENGNFSLTDAQYDALDHGVGRGESLLVVSPTSTGKTQIALWAIANSVEAGCNAVYLVTHRALAKQKFNDFQEQLLEHYYGNDASALVVATGDYIENAEGDIPTDPLRSPLLVATYEKYLAMLSASGIPADMGSTVIICDEIQLIGDQHRGQSVEVLLTLLRNAGWKQFVGLSAVLEATDARDLASWLKVRLVIQYAREKHLHFECWTSSGITAVTSEQPDNIEEGIPLPSGARIDTLSILSHLLNQKCPAAPIPVIVFCMSKRETYELAEQFWTQRVRATKGDRSLLSLDFDGLPETSANSLLSKTMAHRIAFHNADLMDEERHIVEGCILDGKLDVVFATSTLAAGVNFPFGAAIFASWERWDKRKRAYVAIESAEFHNMAGRVGRMGFEHEQGRVIFFANSTTQIRNARYYLNLGSMPPLRPRVTPTRFNQLALQLVASGLCNDRSMVQDLVCQTLSALREQDGNPYAFSAWPNLLQEAISELTTAGLLIENSAGRLLATPVGKTVGLSGLVPETADFLMEYVAGKAEKLVSLLPTPSNPGDVSTLSFLIFSACFSSPEFRTFHKKPPTRFLPFPLESGGLINADIYKDDLIDPVWQADLSPINAAKLTLDWINGKEVRALESELDQLSAGMLRDMFRNLVWALQGVASIIAAGVDPTVPELQRPKAFRTSGIRLDLISKLPRVIRRLSFRVAEGLPDDVLWMCELNTGGSAFRLSRPEILALRGMGLSTPEQVMLGTPEADKLRLKAFEKAKPAPKGKANWLRDSCRNWKQTQRKRSSEWHIKRARKCPQKPLVEAYYVNKGTDFEHVFEEILLTLKISYLRLDDRTKTGAPDYLVTLKDCPPLVVELKSKEGDNLVDYNRAVEVLAASEIHGHRDTFCVTLCHPGVDPSVPMVIASCGRLSVVESCDLGEAFLRLCEGTLNLNQLYTWLATPGQALRSDLPFTDYS